jgi:hypothetical protein
MVAATNVTAKRIRTHLDARDLMLVPTALGGLRAMPIRAIQIEIYSAAARIGNTSMSKAMLLPLQVQWQLL